MSNHISEMVTKLMLNPDAPLLPWPELSQDEAFVAFTIDHLRVRIDALELELDATRS